MARKMKDSGIAWVGKIPEGWEVSRIDVIANRKAPRYSPSEDLLSVFLDRGVIRFVDGGSKRANITSNDLSKYQLVEPGDFVLNNQQAWRGSVGVSKYRGIISPAYLILKLKQEIDSTYANYLLRSTPLVSIYEQCSHGVGSIQRNIYWDEFKARKIPLPPLAEQERIAEYLDKTVGRIDGLREKISREIERLGDYKKSMISEAVCRGLDKTAKMKDSGIPWVGKIPEGWEVTRLQWHLEEVNEINTPVKCNFILSLTNDRGVIPYSEKGNQGNKAKEDVSSYKLAYKDCIIANSMNIIIGSVGLSNYDGCVSPVYYVFRARNGACVKFINYIFQTAIFQRELRRHAKGILEIRLRISAWAILKQKIPIPPLAEQKRIAEYIDKQVAKIDALIEKRKAEFERLEALKRSIICECVTGKMEVAA